MQIVTKISIPAPIQRFRLQCPRSLSTWSVTDTGDCGCVDPSLSSSGSLPGGGREERRWVSSKLEPQPQRTSPLILILNMPTPDRIPDVIRIGHSQWMIRRSLFHWICVRGPVEPSGRWSCSGGRQLDSATGWGSSDMTVCTSHESNLDFRFQRPTMKRLPASGACCIAVFGGPGAAVENKEYGRPIRCM